MKHPKIEILHFAVPDRGLAIGDELLALIAAEVNVKQVVLTDDISAYATFVLRPNGKVLGPPRGRYLHRPTA